MAASNGAFDYKAPNAAVYVKRKLFDKTNKAPAALVNIDQNPFIETLGITSGPSPGVVARGDSYYYIFYPNSKTVKFINNSGVIVSKSDLPAVGNWVSAACYSSSYIFVIASGSATGYYSSDGGSTWNSMTLPSAATWTSCSMAYDGKAIAVASGGTAAAYSTDFGASWIAKTLPASANWTSCAIGLYSTSAIAIASGNTTAAYSSNGGQTWTAATLPVSATWTSCRIYSSIAAAVSLEGNAAYSSNSGQTWTTKTFPSGSNWKYMSHAWSGTVVAICSGTSTVAVSTDGGNAWTAYALTRSANWVGTQNGAGGFGAVGSGGEFERASSGVGDWTNFGNINTVPYIFALGYGNGRFIFPPHSENVGAYSNDGITWSPTGVFPSTSYVSIAYGGDRWVAVTANTCAYSTDDGATWVAGGNMTIGGTYLCDAKSIIYANGLFVVCGDIRDTPGNSTMNVLTSPNGVTWTARLVSYSVTGYYVAIAYNNGYFALFPNLNNGALAQSLRKSINGITWTDDSTLNPAYIELNYCNQYTISPAKSKGFICYTKISLSGVRRNTNGTHILNSDTSLPRVFRQVPFSNSVQELYASGTYNSTLVASDPKLSDIVAVHYSSELCMYVVVPISNGEGFLSNDALNWFKFPISEIGVQAVGGAYNTYSSWGAVASGNGRIVILLNLSNNSILSLSSDPNAQSVILEK